VKQHSIFYKKIRLSAAVLTSFAVLIKNFMSAAVGMVPEVVC